MPGAAARVAAKLAEKAAADKAVPAAAEPDEAVEQDGEEPEDEDEAPAKPMSLKERAAAARAAKTGKPNGAEPVSVAKPAAPAAKAKPAAKGAGGTGPGKKAPSPAQLAARAAFAARSKAAAAERAGGDPISKAISAAAETGEARVNLRTGKVTVTPVPKQTPEQIKAKQNADRKAQRDKIADAEAVRPTREATSKPKKVQETASAAKARIAKEKAEAARVAKASGAKKAKVSKATTDRAPIGDTKAKVHALIAKGKTRPEIVKELGLSYAAVMYHAKSAAGGQTAARGSIFVDTNLDEEGHKLRGGKKINVSRSEAMRRSYRSGVSVGDTARAFDVRYQIAYTAIKPILGEEVEDE